MCTNLSPLPCNHGLATAASGRGASNESLQKLRYPYILRPGIAAAPHVLDEGVVGGRLDLHGVLYQPVKEFAYETRASAVEAKGTLAQPRPGGFAGPPTTPARKKRTPDPGRRRSR
jgi:hypothetical protein